jgi:flagellar biosynthesis protein FliR
MIDDVQAWITVGLIVMVRVSAFFSILPFFAVARVPATIRVYLAISVSFALTPLLFDAVHSRITTLGEGELLAVVAREVAIGLFLGFLVRVFFLAVAFVAEFVSQQLGFMGMFVPSIAEGELMSPLADLVVLFTVVLFLISDLHLVLIRALVTSYDVVQVASGLDLSVAIGALSMRISTVFLWGLQLAAPFVLYVTVCNFLLGLANRLVPQVPIQFVMAPAILIGGLALALFVLTLAAERLIDKFTVGAFGI